MILFNILAEILNCYTSDLYLTASDRKRNSKHANSVKKSMLGGN
jgi:hypothetical protein